MDIKRVHEINLILLKEVDRICKKYGIKYRLEAGTLLGAVRHKGFIPWDDDCDIAFLRPEYERFKEALKKETLSDGIVFVEAKSNVNHFHDFVDRLFYIKEVYREDKIYGERFDGIFRYVWLDIFVLDNLDDKNEKQIFLQQKINYGEALAYRYDIDMDKYKALHEKLEVKILSTIGKTKSLSKIYEEHDKLSKKDIDKDTKYVYYSNYPIIYMGYKLERSIENDIIEVDFEGIKLPIMKEYDKVLTYFYGDYMAYPETEKQVPEHKNNIW